MSDENISSETQLTKEKKSWFHSLSRRKKLQAANNNDSTEKSNNFLKRMRKKLSLTSLRRKSRDDIDDDDDEKNGTTDATEEFFRKPTLQNEFNQLSFKFEPEENQAISCLHRNNGDDEDTIPFSQVFQKLLAQKWKNSDCDENSMNIMLRASTEMLSQVWYWGEISRRDAQKQLTDKPTGSFLVRDSETEIGFTLSFRIINVTLHYRLEYRENYWRFEELQYESIVEMIEDILYRCTNDNFLCFVKVPNDMQPQFPVILKYPLSRYLKMPLLQDLCRLKLQQNLTTAEIAKLPLPTKLQVYLAEKRGLVFAY